MKFRIQVFVKRMSRRDCIEKLYSTLVNRVGRSDGLILTTTKKPPKHLALPGNHQILALNSCIKMDSEYFQLDTRMIEGLFKVQKPLSPKKQQFECHANGALIIVNHDDQPSQEFYFKGKQRQCVDYIYQSWVNGKEIVDIDKMFETLDFEGTKRLASLFSGKKGWKELIASEGKKCWLIPK
jgi:hypothetical protein